MIDSHYIYACGVNYYETDLKMNEINRRKRDFTWPRSFAGTIYTVVVK